MNPYIYTKQTLRVLSGKSIRTITFEMEFNNIY